MPGPTHIQTIQGDLHIGSNLQVDTNTFFVDSISNTVGIGTTNPVSKLHINPNTTSTASPSTTGVYIYNTNTGDATCTVRVKDSNAGDPYISFDIANEYGWSWGMDNSDANKMKLSSSWDSLSSSTKMTIDTSGNVGIGTASPGGLLHVEGTSTSPIIKRNGSAATSTFNYILNGARPGTTSGGAVHFINGSSRTDDGGTSAYTIRNDSGNLILGSASYDTLLLGDVGIGVTDPDTKLEVRGSIKASYSDTDHGMIVDSGGTVRRDYGGYGVGFHFTNNAIWPTNYLGNYSAGGMDFGSSSYRWNNIYTEALNASGDLTVSGKIYNYNYTEVDINDPATVSGTWTTSDSSTSWGDPKFNHTYDKTRWNDAPGYVEYTIPTGMKSAYISQLQWNTGGYVDVHGVQSDGGLVFLRRINTRQTVENTDEGNPNQHDGQTITFAGSGLEHYSKIRLTNKLGRFHLDGVAFTPNENEGTEGTGMVHSAQISDLGSGIPTPTGTGASGTWGINITGNADTVDNLHASSFLRSDASDTVSAGVTYSWAATNTHGLQFTNASFSGYYLYIGGWSSSNDNNISRIRNSNGNLHIDSAANGSLFLNWYTGGSVEVGSTMNLNGSMTVANNTNLGNGNGDWTHINDILYLGATDSGDSHFYFGEDSAGWYGEHWYWDSGHTTNRYSRHAGTDTLIERHDTRYTHKIQTNRAYERLGHSTGYQIGSYNSVGSNDAKSNPIYTIGDNYRPSDTSLVNMYGIGYSHSNFTSILTGGWGMYVAANGTARIGLNGDNGDIKNTGHIYCGNTVYIGGSTSRGLRAVSGDYGTVQTTGEGANGWEGYSIDGRYVFMSADSNSCGIYNDIDNEWMIYCYRNTWVRLYYDGAEKLETNSGGVTVTGTLGATDVSSGAVYYTNWLRCNSTGAQGLYWHNSSNPGYLWHIYPENQQDMTFRTGSGNGGIKGTVSDATARGYIHWTTSNEIGFLNNGRGWSLRMDSSNNCQIYGGLTVDGYSTMTGGATIRRLTPYSYSYGSGYNTAAIEVREYGLECATGGTEWARAPRIGFHWCGRVASQILCEASGRISVVNNPGNAFEAFAAASVYTSGTIEADGRIYADNGCHVRGDWLRVNGNNGIYFESYGGGWNMSDTTWIRTVNSKSLWCENGIMATNYRCGVGTSAPLVPLHVYGTGASLNNGNFRYLAIGGSSSGYGTWGALCASFEGGHVRSTDSFLAHNGSLNSSDERIKKEISDIDDASALETLRLIQPKTYKYKDEEKMGSDVVYGFIAQQIKEVLPYATKTLTDYLPSICEMSNVTQSNVITFTNFNTNDLLSNTTIIQAQLFKGENKDLTISEIIDEHSIRVEEDLTEMLHEDDTRLYIYGEQVDDFVFLKKESIFTIATAALQEVDRQLQAEKTKVTTLETQLASVLARLDALENPPS